MIVYLSIAIFFGLIVGILLGRNLLSKHQKRAYQLLRQQLEKEKRAELESEKQQLCHELSKKLHGPLQSVRSHIEELREGGFTFDIEIGKDLCSRVYQKMDESLRVIDRLIEPQKPDTDFIELTIRKKDLRELMEETLVHLQHSKFNTQLDICQSGTLPKTKDIWCDPIIIERVIQRILTWKPASSQEKVTIGIQECVAQELQPLVQLELGTGDVLNITITYLDVYLNEEETRSILQHSYTNYADENHPNVVTANDHDKWNQVGAMVRLHNGYFYVMNRLGIGTEFSVIIPKGKEGYSRKQAPLPTYTRPSITYSQKNEMLSRTLNEKEEGKVKLPILLAVEGNADIRLFIKQALGEEYVIHEAENGCKGLEMAKKLMPSIILTDLVMPETEGMKLCRELKKNPATSHIPLVILTSEYSKRHEQQGLAIGADEYIRKPFDMDLLQSKLSNIIKEKVNQDHDDCAPQINNGAGKVEEDNPFLKKATAVVEKNMMNTEFNVEMMVEEMGLSRSNLYLKLKELTGLSSSGFVRNIRLQHAVQLLERGDLSVKEIMYMTGFNTASYFSKCFKKEFGVIPSEYAQHHRPIQKERVR